jgi:peptide/nickel transport system ATP-binding protein
VSHNRAVVAFMCDRLAVMNRGLFVEEMDVATLRREQPREAYTRQLLLASKGYDRLVASQMVSFD